MPIYEYQCDACGERFEQRQRITDPAVTDCPACAKPEVRRLISATSFQLKGSGWYISDYSRKQNEPSKSDDSRPSSSSH